MVFAFIIVSIDTLSKIYLKNKISLITLNIGYLNNILTNFAINFFSINYNSLFGSQKDVLN